MGAPPPPGTRRAVAAALAVDKLDDRHVGGVAGRARASRHARVPGAVVARAELLEQLAEHVSIDDGRRLLPPACTSRCPSSRFFASVTMRSTSRRSSFARVVIVRMRRA